MMTMPKSPLQPSLLLELTMNRPSDLRVTVFPNATDAQHGEVGTVADVIGIIQGATLSAATKYIRECLDNGDPGASEAKRQLPVIVWAGEFSARNNASCTAYSGLVVLDLDDLDDAVAVRDTLAGDPHLVCCFRSPGGSGCKPVVLTDASSPADHAQAWLTACQYLKTTYGLTVSGGQGDVARACFACHDPDAFINAEAQPLAVDRSLNLPAPGPVTSAASPERIRKDRHPYLIAYCARLARAGMGASEIRAAAEALIRDRFDCTDGRVFAAKEIEDAVRSGCAKFAGPDEAAAIVHGAEVAAILIANYEARTTATDGGRIADPGPLPADWCDLPGLGGKWIKHCLARSVIPQPELALGAVLAACGALIGPRLAAGTARANLYLFGVANTGHGKNAAREGIMQTLTAAGPEAVELLGNENLKSDAGLVTELVQRRNKVFLIDEAGYLLAAANANGAGAYLTGIPQVLLQLYTSSHLTWRGGAYADAERNPVIKCPHACLYACSTPAKLWDAMTMDSLDGGLLGRCLFVFGLADKPARRRPTPADCTPPAELIDGIRAWVSGRGYFADNDDAEQVPVEAEALAIYDQTVLEIDDLERGALKNHPCAAVFTRVGQTAERLGLIRAWCRDQVNPVVTVDDARWACGLTLHCARRLAHHASDRIRSDDNPWENAYRRVLGAIRRAGGTMTRRQLIRAVRLPARFLDQIVEQGVEAGEIAMEEKDADRIDCPTSGGRPLLTYRLL
jgi:hypothetical protein